MDQVIEIKSLYNFLFLFNLLFFKASNSGPCEWINVFYLKSVSIQMVRLIGSEPE